MMTKATADRVLRGLLLSAVVCSGMPAMHAQTPSRPGPPPNLARAPAITSFSINDNMENMETVNPVYLTLTYTGTPTEYRVSETSEQFPESTAGWQPFVLYQAFGGAVRLPTQNRWFATTAPTKRVYLQLRNGTAASNVASDAINVQHRYSLTGQDAVDQARARGFTFSTTTPCKVFYDGIEAFPGAFVIRLLSPRFSGSSVCVNTLFGGRALAPGWQFTNLKWRISNQSGDCRITSSPQLPAVRLFTQVFFAGTQCDMVLENVELKGPAGVSWQDAFRS